MAGPEAVVMGAGWSACTILSYGAARGLYQRMPRWWTSPLMLAPAPLLALAIGLHISYRTYIQGTHWLVLMLGPATVAFALPIYEQRALIRRHALPLMAGAVAGSAASLASGWALAALFGLSDSLRLSLLPRSITTPFAMNVSGRIGGMPDLTAVFVVVTGLCGATLGELLLHWMPLRSSLARGALFGMGAHGAGVAKAHQIGAEEGSMAGLVMVLAGLLNVFIAALLTAR